MSRRLMLITFALLLTCTVAHGQERFKAEAICALYPQLCPNGAMAEDWTLLKQRARILDASPPGLQADLRQGWWPECRHDPIYDTKSCSIHRGSLSIVLTRRQGSITPIVNIFNLKSSFPGRTNALRVDTLPAHTMKTETYWAGRQAQTIITQLLKGQTARTQFIAWPSENAINDEIPLDGFGDAFQQLQTAVNQP